MAEFAIMSYIYLLLNYISYNFRAYRLNFLDLVFYVSITLLPKPFKKFKQIVIIIIICFLVVGH